MHHRKQLKDIVKCDTYDTLQCFKFIKIIDNNIY